MKSKLFSLNMKDAARSLFMAVTSAAGTALLQFVNSGMMPTKEQFRVVLGAGIAAGLSYVLKNFLTNSKDELLKKEEPSAPTS